MKNVFVPKVGRVAVREARKPICCSGSATAVGGGEGEAVSLPVPVELSANANISFRCTAVAERRALSALESEHAQEGVDPSLVLARGRGFEQYRNRWSKTPCDSHRHAE